MGLVWWPARLRRPGITRAAGTCQWGPSACRPGPAPPSVSPGLLPRRRRRTRLGLAWFWRWDGRRRGRNGTQGRTPELRLVPGRLGQEGGRQAQQLHIGHRLADGEPVIYLVDCELTQHVHSAVSALPQRPGRAAGTAKGGNVTSRRSEGEDAPRPAPSRPIRARQRPRPCASGPALALGLPGARPGPAPRPRLSWLWPPRVPELAARRPELM